MHNVGVWYADKNGIEYVKLLREIDGVIIVTE